MVKPENTEQCESSIDRSSSAFAHRVGLAKAPAKRLFIVSTDSQVFLSAKT